MGKSEGMGEELATGEGEGEGEGKKRQGEQKRAVMRSAHAPLLPLPPSVLARRRERAAGGQSEAGDGRAGERALAAGEAAAQAGDQASERSRAQTNAAGSEAELKSGHAAHVAHGAPLIEESVCAEGGHCGGEKGAGEKKKGERW